MDKIIEYLKFGLLWRVKVIRILLRKIYSRDSYAPFDDLIGMSSNEERNYFFNYAAHTYTGKGEVVELGCWLGSSTIPLLSGFAENEKSGNHKVHAYDSFIWHEKMNDSVKYLSFKSRYRPGDNFRIDFEKQVAPYRNNIELHEGDILRQTWNGAPIELLLVDVMKSWEIAQHVVTEFYPCLLPGQSTLIHQDFCHHYTSWIHLIQYRLREYFEPVENVRFSESMVFKTIGQLSDGISEIPQSMGDFSADEVEHAFRYSLSLVHPENIPAVLAAKVMMYRHLGDYNQAWRQLDTIPSSMRNSVEIKAVRNTLVAESPQSKWVNC